MRNSTQRVTESLPLKKPTEETSGRCSIYAKSNLIVFTCRCLKHVKQGQDLAPVGSLECELFQGTRVTKGWDNG